MPLPDSAPLSLQVNSNAVQSKPKRAMIVRMSAETLDALTEAFPNPPPMSFDFGAVPGIYIGDAFFPIRPQKESSPHELYLRAASAAKPMAPLKLYANVVGKFMVERQLGDKVKDRVRQQTIAAQQQHKERQAILLSQPPIPGPAAKNGKRKLPGSGTVLKKSPALDQLRLASSSAQPSRKVSPLPQNTPSSKASSDVRRRLVQFLAVAPRLTDDAVKMVGGANIVGSARDNLLALLDEVAEQMPGKKGDKSPRPWQLKPQTWTEVRPYEWPKLSEAERIDMARRARIMFNALKIPETDPVWEYVRHRPQAQAVPTAAPAAPPMAASTSSRSSTTGQPETKRSAITMQETKSKSKQDPSRAKGEIQMKDESAKAAVSRVSAIKRAEVERPPSPSESSTSAKTIASRRVPGSGYQKKSSQPSPDPERPAVPAARPSHPAVFPPKPPPVAPSAAGSHARKTISTMPSKPTKKEDESDREKDREHERQREREREKREREKEKLREERERVREQERLEMEKREKVRQKEREAMEREKRLREKDLGREEMEQQKRQREKERMPKERPTGGAVSSLQRKVATQLAEDIPDDTFFKASPAPKRRKLDDGTSVASSSSTVRDSGLAVSKNVAHEPSPVPRLKMKKGRGSPQPSITSTQERRATSSASGSTYKSERPTKL